MWTHATASSLLILVLHPLLHCAAKTRETPSPSSSSSSNPIDRRPENKDSSQHNSQYSTISGIVYSFVFVMIIIVSLIRVWDEWKSNPAARVQQFRGISPVIVSRLPLYVEKSKFYPSCSFVIGADVCRKILDPKYTGESIAQMYCDLEQIRGRGCRFLVAGRKNSITEEFETVDTILEEKILNHVDREAISNLFQPVNGFRVDLSSSEIRKSEGEKEGKL